LEKGGWESLSWLSILVLMLFLMPDDQCCFLYGICFALRQGLALTANSDAIIAIEAAIVPKGVLRQET
jgi:hypothetical protein